MRTYPTKIETLTERLEHAVRDNDNEVAHRTYDEIMHELAKCYAATLVKRIDTIIKDTTFLYA